jgi:hypothetical protein
VAVLNQLPDSASQIHAFVDERAIGLPISTLPTQINRAARVAFESAAFYISGMAMATYDARPDPDQQRETRQDVDRRSRDRADDKAMAARWPRPDATLHGKEERRCRWLGAALGRKQQPPPVAGASSGIIADAVSRRPTVRCS